MRGSKPSAGVMWVCLGGSNDHKLNDKLYKDKTQTMVHDPSFSHVFSTTYFCDKTEKAALGFGFRTWGTPVWISQAT